MEMDTLLPHCLEVRRKILDISSVEAHQGPSQFRVFPTTLSTLVQSIWEVIIDVGDYTADNDGFDEALQTFIKRHAIALPKIGTTLYSSYTNRTSLEK
jgi:hypothetical protein